MAPSPPLDRRGFEIALICALPLEAGFVESVFDTFWEDEGKEYGKADEDKNSYTTGAIGEYNVVLAHMPGMGKVSAAFVASSLRISFPAIRLAVVVGICGAVPVDQHGHEIILGDVIVSQLLVQYDFGRQQGPVFDTKNTLEDSYGRPNPEIRSFLAKSQTPRSRRKIQEDAMRYLRQLQKNMPTARYPGVDADRLYRSDYLHKHREAPDETCRQDSQVCARAHRMSCGELGCDPTKLVARQRLQEVDPGSSDIAPAVHFGTIGSADTVMRSGEERDRLARRDNITAFEMEGAGVWEFFSSVIIKGVCDYADSHKNKNWQDYAAATAACCMKALLKRMTPEDRPTERTVEDRLSRATLEEAPSGAATRQPPVDTVDQREVVVWNVPFDQLSTYVGRKKEVDLLRSKLFSTAGRRRVAVCGLGGIGKSRIAWEMANYARSLDKPYSVLWVQSTTISTFEEGFFEVGRMLKIPGIEYAGSDRKQLIKRHLSAESSGKWLLILDNADDESIWCPTIYRDSPRPSLLDYVPRQTRGSVLVTTRSQRVAARLAGRDTIFLQNLEQKEGIQVLQSLLIDPVEAVNLEAAKDLVGRLAGLPLALVQAAAYMNMNNASLGDYLELLRSTREEDIISLLSEDYDDESRYEDARNSVASTWFISFEQIHSRNKQAIDYLSFMSCLDEKNIPQSLLPELPSKRDHIESIGVLSGYSFIQKQNDSPVATTLYSIHLLVRLATRNWLRSQGTLLKWTEQAMDRLLDVFPEVIHENRHWYRLYLPHVQALCDADCDTEPDLRFKLLRLMGLCLLEDGKYREAVDCFRPVAEWRAKEKGDLDRYTLESFKNLGEALKKQGEWAQAEKYVEKSVAGRKEVLGPEHALTLTSMFNLAAIYWQQGRWERAETLHGEVLEARKRVLGPEHVATLTSMSDLALTYWSQGRYDESEKLDLQVLAIRRDVLGVEHPATLTTMSNLALTYDTQSRYQEAEDMYHDVIRIRKRILGPEHPDTLVSIANLACTYYDQGRWEETEAIEIDVLSIRKRVLGVEHPDTLLAMSNNAWTIKRQGRHAEALELMTKSARLSRLRLGGDHPDTITREGDVRSWKNVDKEDGDVDVDDGTKASPDVLEQSEVQTPAEDSVENTQELPTPPPTTHEEGGVLEQAELSSGTERSDKPSQVTGRQLTASPDTNHSSARVND